LTRFSSLNSNDTWYVWVQNDSKVRNTKKKKIAVKWESGKGTFRVRSWEKGI